MAENNKKKLFDEWPEEYDRWFATPIGGLVKKYESELLLSLLNPAPGEIILDAGCGTGVFTLDFLSRGANVIGLDVSLPMLKRAGEKTRRYWFRMVLGDMLNLPFPDGCFDRVVSVTALEFIGDAKGAVKELFRVTRIGGCIVVATLNSLSPWAISRRAEAKKMHTIFKKAIFRSPDQLSALVSLEGMVQTAIHFQKEDRPDIAPEIEDEGRKRGRDTGALVAARWIKP